VTGAEVAATSENGYLTFEIDQILDHDVIVIDDHRSR
jgi:hypothetical protein